MVPSSLLATAQVLLAVLLHVSSVACGPSSGPEDHLGSVLEILWPFESLEKAQENAGDNLVSVEDTGKIEEVGKVVKKMRVRKRKRKKKVISAPPLDIRDRP